MTYKNLVDNLKDIITAHYMVKTYGYGTISDISVPDNEEPPNYPYVFVNPDSISNGLSSFEWTFNLIVMTQVNDGEDAEVSGQDECIQIIQDIVSTYVSSMDNPLITFEEPFSVTPFKERFSDDVVGATALITLNYGKAIDGCDTPFPPGTGGNRPSGSCPQVLVTDGDDSEHWVDAGGSYSCLPATAKSGIFYQRVIPFDNERTDDPENSVGWLRRYTDTYDYTPPTNPQYIAALANGYEGNDANCRLAQLNAFGNYWRFTDRSGNQYIEVDNNTNPQGNYCIDNLTGLGIYVDVPYDYENYTWAQAIDNAASFTGEGYDDWRLADVGEFLAIYNMNDWVNAWTVAYTPWLNNRLRAYGARLWMGCRDRDGNFVYTITNGGTIATTTSTTLTLPHSIKVRNHFW